MHYKFVNTLCNKLRSSGLQIFQMRRGRSHFAHIHFAILFIVQILLLLVLTTCTWRSKVRNMPHFMRHIVSQSKNDWSERMIAVSVIFPWKFIFWYRAAAPWWMSNVKPQFCTRMFTGFFTHSASVTINFLIFVKIERILILISFRFQWRVRHQACASQCGNYRIFQSLRFYVKSKLENL